MLGKTHMVVGIAASLAVTMPEKVTYVIMATGAGAIGALISDIDVETSSSHKDANRIVFATVAITIVSLILEYFAGFGIIDNVRQDSVLFRMVVGALLFVGICAFGKEQPHRSFMHSILALLLLDFSLALIYTPIVPYFTAGFISHIVLDLLNKKKVKLFYPLKKGICFNLFKAGGTANKMFFVCGCFLTVAELVFFLFRKYF